jgi:imidazole glycerol-phosphate synthase subunit HisH
MITILDYGSGNISAIVRLAKLSNVETRVATGPAGVADARHILLPGVGAFDRTMDAFVSSGLADALTARLNQPDVWCLGICVGMHVLADSSDEGSKRGLGLIPGHVKRFRAEDIPEKPKIPHMGWNTLETVRPHPLLEGLDTAQGFYFLHSYRYACDAPDDVIATSTHGTMFHSVIGRGRVLGVQFHPEKSHHNGVRLIRNFLAL